MTMQILENTEETLRLSKCYFHNGQTVYNRNVIICSLCYFGKRQIMDSQFYTRVIALVCVWVCV